MHRHPEPEPAGPPIERFYRATLLPAEDATFYRTSDDGGGDGGGDGDGEAGAPLELPEGGVSTAFRFHGMRELEGDSIHYPIVETRVADAGGRWFAARGFLDPDAFCQPLDPDHCRREGAIHYWHQAPESWRRPLLEASDLRNVGGLLDSRIRCEIRVGQETQIILFKYQGPEMDVVWSPEDGDFIVRAKRMVFEQWEGDPFARSEGAPEEDHGRFIDIVDDLTLVYRVPFTDLSLLTTPDFHWREWEQWYEEDDPKLCRPLFEPSEPPAG